MLNVVNYMTLHTCFEQEKVLHESDVAKSLHIPFENPLLFDHSFHLLCMKIKIDANSIFFITFYIIHDFKSIKLFMQQTK